MKKIYYLNIFDSANRFREKIDMTAKYQVMSKYVCIFLGNERIYMKFYSDKVIIL